MDGSLKPLHSYLTLSMTSSAIPATKHSDGSHSRTSMIDGHRFLSGRSILARPKWTALINKYIKNIPVSGDASCIAEQSISDGPPPRVPVSTAMTAKVGAAASDTHSAAPNWVRRFVSVALHRKRVLEAGSTSLVNPASTGRVMIPAVHLDCAAVAIHVAGPHPVGKAMIRAGLLASLRRHIQDSVGGEELFAAAPEARVGEIDISVVLLEEHALTGKILDVRRPLGGRPEIVDRAARGNLVR